MTDPKTTDIDESKKMLEERLIRLDELSEFVRYLAYEIAEDVGHLLDGPMQLHVDIAKDAMLILKIRTQVMNSWLWTWEVISRQYFPNREPELSTIKSMLSETQFRAASSVGLNRIAESGAGDNVTRGLYENALIAVEEGKRLATEETGDGDTP